MRVEFQRRTLLRSALAAPLALAAGRQASAQEVSSWIKLKGILDRLSEQGINNIETPLELILHTPRVFRVLSSISNFYRYPDAMSGQPLGIYELSKGSLDTLPAANSPDSTVKIILPEERTAVRLTRRAYLSEESEKVRQQWLFLDFLEGEEVVFENAGGAYRFAVEGGPLSILLNHKDPETGNYTHLAQIYYPRHNFLLQPEERVGCSVEEADITGPNGEKDGQVDEWDDFKASMAMRDDDLSADMTGDGAVTMTDLSCIRAHFGRSYQR